MKPGDLVKFNDRFFQNFGEHSERPTCDGQVDGNVICSRKSRGVLIREITRNRLIPDASLWEVLFEGGVSRFSKAWLERVEE